MAAAKFTDTSDQKALVSSIERELKNFRLKFISAIEMSTVDINLSARHVAEANDSYTKFTDAILELVDWAVRDSRAGVVKLNRIGERRSLVSIIVAIGLVAVLSGLTILVLPRIIGPVRRVTDVMHRLAEGDMTVTIPDKQRTDEVGQMTRAVQVFLENAIRRADLEAQLQHEQQEHLERQRRNAEELEVALAKEKELNEMQRQFVSMASHEFRTPLATIDNTAQRLKRQADKDKLTPTVTSERVKKIREAVVRMTKLIDSTLSLARMDNGKITIEVDACDVGKAVTQVCDRQQEIAKSHVISYDVSSLPDTIQADSGALDQMLTNLLSNAVKYAPDDPVIEVKAQSIEDCVMISVRDHGLGIDDDELPQLFARFFRAKTSTGIAGTGIGLHLVKSLVELHDGSVDVESIKGEGTTFTIRLPVAGPRQPEQPRPESVAA